MKIDYTNVYRFTKPLQLWDEVDEGKRSIPFEPWTPHELEEAINSLQKIGIKVKETNGILYSTNELENEICLLTCVQYAADKANTIISNRGVIDFSYFEDLNAFIVELYYKINSKAVNHIFLN